jgi:hypothetical protein
MTQGAWAGNNASAIAACLLQTSLARLWKQSFWIICSDNLDTGD